MRWESCWYLIRADAYRESGATDARGVVRTIWAHPPSRMLLVYRVGGWARSGGGRRLTRVLTGLAYRRCSTKYGIEIPFRTVIGPGLRLNHRVGSIILNVQARLGSSVTLSPFVVVGNNPPHPEAPTIGDGVVLSVGAKVIGPVHVGDGAVVGANAVVVHDVEEGSVVAGVPARALVGRSPVSSRRLDFEDVLGPIPDEVLAMLASPSPA